jgi:hypothetical protein
VTCGCPPIQAECSAWVNGAHSCALPIRWPVSAGGRVWLLLDVCNHKPDEPVKEQLRVFAGHFASHRIDSYRERSSSYGCEQRIAGLGSRRQVGQFTTHPIAFAVSPSACSHAPYKLANDGHYTRAIQAYLGHHNIQNTTRYTALAPQRFKEFFRD